MWSPIFLLPPIPPKQAAITLSAILFLHLIWLASPRISLSAYCHAFSAINPSLIASSVYIRRYNLVLTMPADALAPSRPAAVVYHGNGTHNRSKTPWKRHLPRHDVWCDYGNSSPLYILSKLFVLDILIMRGQRQQVFDNKWYSYRYRFIRQP